MAYRLAWEEPRAVEDLAHVEKFFARNLGSLIRARTGKPGRFMKATAHGLSVSSNTVSRTSASCGSLQNGSMSALSNMDAEHAAYVALRKAR
jgi:hypothetical protein